MARELVSTPARGLPGLCGEEAAGVIVYLVLVCFNLGVSWITGNQVVCLRRAGSETVMGHGS